MQILAVQHSASYTLRGIKRAKMLCPHASSYVASYRKALDTGTGYQYMGGGIGHGSYRKALETGTDY